MANNENGLYAADNSNRIMNINDEQIKNNTSDVKIIQKTYGDKLSIQDTRGWRLLSCFLSMRVTSTISMILDEK